MFADMKRKKVAGVTLVEVIVVVLVIGLLMSAVFLAFSSGSKTALHGMVKNEITLEARALLRQVHDDLRYSVFYIDYSAPGLGMIDDYFDKIVSASDGTLFTFLRFPLHGSIEEAISSDSSSATRIPVRITYELKRQKNQLFSFSRKEGNKPESVLSKRVVYFEIKENPAAPAKTSWLVGLQLANKADSSDSEDNETSDSPASGRLVKVNGDVQVANFFDVVASEYFSRFRRSRAIPNWNTLVGNP